MNRRKEIEEKAIIKHDEVKGGGGKVKREKGVRKYGEKD